jgi:hypothetical protein
MRSFVRVGSTLAMLVVLGSAGTAGSQEQQQVFDITPEPQQCPAGYHQETVIQCHKDRTCTLVGYTCAPD